MTRGKIVIITEKGYIQTTEYNGDMYISGYGKEVMEWLKEVKDKDTFFNKNFMFCKKYYKDSEEIYKKHKIKYKKPDITIESTIYIKENGINLNYETYMDKWFSDYIYIKNTTQKTQEITNSKGKTKKIKPNEIQVYYFGRKLSDKAIKKEMEE